MHSKLNMGDLSILTGPLGYVHTYVVHKKQNGIPHICADKVIFFTEFVFKGKYPTIYEVYQ